jgi:1-acyl-sn-glycerol-3-phosphate acyltransferase
MTRKLRAALYAAYFFAVTLVFGMAGVVVRFCFPARALWLAKAWVGVLLAGLRPVCGIRVVVSGLHHLPDNGPALIASEHQSEFDTLVWMRLLKRPSYVMKQELLRTPLVGPMLVPAGMIPLDRKAGAAALRRLLQDTLAARDAGRQIVIFPQGTRVRPGEVVAPQPGIAAVAKALGTPVVPVATDSGLCWSREKLGKFAGTIHIAIGPPIAAGTPRDALLAAIGAFWDEAAAKLYKPVDKSVEQIVARAGEAAPNAR